jgi:hypothetical protein
MRKVDLMAQIAEAYWHCANVVEDTANKSKALSPRDLTLAIHKAILDARRNVIIRLQREIPDDRPFVAEPIPHDEIKAMINEWESRGKKK